MAIESVLVELASQIGYDQITKEQKATLISQIRSSASDLTSNPRDHTNGNTLLLNATMAVALGIAQNRYGIGDDAGLYLHPLFGDKPHSQLMPLERDNREFAIVLGMCVRSWEDVFYDICHESLHLLNPVLIVKGDGGKVSALEEGVAVKFAEDMYDTHIRTYCDHIPLTSPINDPSSQYFRAYCAAKKIPDALLKEVRRIFGRFSDVNDSEKLRYIVTDYLDDEEIRTLIEPFRYP